MAEDRLFTWIPFYQELAVKLLEYKDNRQPLIEFVYSDEMSLYTNFLHKEDKTHFKDIDPFTFIGIFNRGQAKWENRTNIARIIKDYFALSSEVPTDFSGVPVLNALRSFYMPWDNDVIATESCNHYWNLFVSCMNGNINNQEFDVLLKRAGIGLGMTTIPLYWSKPNEYLALDSRNVAYLKSIGIVINIYDTYSYLNLLQEVKNKMASGEIVEKSFSEISYNAWNLKNATRYWLYSPGDNATYWEEFYDLGIMAIGWDDIGDLSAFKNRTEIKNKMVEIYGTKEGPHAYKNVVQCTWDFAKEMNVGDIVFVKQGLSKILGYGVVTSDYFFDDDRDEFCSVRKIDWKQKGVWDHPGQAVQKTLTNITNDTDYVEKLRSLFMNTQIKDFTNILRLKKNIILQGAPGTGKTYNTAALALNICKERDVDFGNHNEVMERYDKLHKEGRIGFVTFHQSIDYEDFVEGIKPKTENGLVSYEVEDGIFKRICKNANQITTEKKSSRIDFTRIRVFKMSLGEKGKDGEEIFNYCVENNVVALGWGENKDFSDCEKREDYKAKYSIDDERKWGATAMEIFKQWMRVGDIILISDGTKSVKAIAKIVGEYEFKDDTPIDMCQFRKVEWVYLGDTIPISKLYDKNLSQQSIYAFYNSSKEGKPDYNSIKVDFLNDIITGRINQEVPLNYVLIIDEINRGNVSKIFGELITLLEADKRIGGDHPIRVTLPYSKESFGVPSNLYIIGTMNTTDRSVGNIDYAVRRRFAFATLKADKELVKHNSIPLAVELFDAVESFIKKHQIDMDFEDLMVGHSYFFAKDENELELKWQYEILPLLNEYIKDGIINAKAINSDVTAADFLLA